MYAETSFQIPFTSSKPGDKEKVRWTPSLGVHVDNSDIQGQGAEGQ